MPIDEFTNNTRKYGPSSPEIIYLSAADSKLKRIIQDCGPLEYQLHEEPFIYVVGTIVSQVISTRVADVLSARLLNLCDGMLTVDRILALDQQQLRNIGLSNAKASYILYFAEQIRSNPTMLDQLHEFSDEEAMKELMKLKGIGSWSAKMYLISVLDRKDILPYEDSAFRQSFSWLYGIEKPSKKDIESICEPWKPYRTIGTKYFYHLIHIGATKKAPLF